MMEIPKVINEITSIQTMTHLQKWAYFLKIGNRIDDSIIQAITKENPFDKAMEVVKMVNSDKKTKDAAFARMRYSMDEAQACHEGKTEGKAAGFQLASLIMAMLRSQISFDEIIEKTGATMDDVLSIYTSMNEPVLTIQEKTN